MTPSYGRRSSGSISSRGFLEHSALIQLSGGRSPAAGKLGAGLVALLIREGILMSVSASRLLAFMRNVAAPDPKVRESAADEVTDLVSVYSLADGRVLAGVLAAAAECETDPAALEAQLNAIIQLGSLAEPEMVARLRALDIERLPGELGDYVEDILEG